MNLVTPELGLLFWQAIIFLVVFLLLSKFAWKPIISGLREREHSIESALQAAAQAKQEMANLKASNEKLLDETRVERDKILKLAQASSENIINEARTKAQAEANRILQETQQAIRNERQAAVADMKKEIVSLSIEIAEKVLKNQLKDEPAQKKLVADLIETAHLN